MSIGSALRARRFRGWARSRLDEIARLREAELWDDVIAASDEILDHPDAEEAQVRNREVERALGEKGTAQAALRRHDEAVDTWRMLADGLAESDDPADRATFARTLYRIANIQVRRLRTPLEALETCDELIALRGEDPERPIVRWLAWVLVLRGEAFDELGRSSDAARAYREVVDRFDGVAYPEVGDCVATALSALGRSLVKLGRLKEALAVLDRVIGRLDDPDRTAMGDGLLARSLITKGTVLYKLDRTTEAAALYAKVNELFGETVDRDLVECVSTAMYDKAAMENEEGRPDAAVETARSTLDWLRDRAAKAPDAGLDGLIASAALMLGSLLELAGRLDESTAQLERLVAEFGESTDSDALEAATNARMTLAERADGSSRPPSSR
jgi:tetratricopeptide (TPR) repeat protein